MLGGKTDNKNIELVKQLSDLRDHIDVHRIIGLNTVVLAGNNISQAFIPYLQKSALEALAVHFCKIFESSNRNELNSIPGIINSLLSTPLSSEQIGDLVALGKKYGNQAKPSEAKSYLQKTFDIFKGHHSQTLACLKEFRDTIGAHSDSKAPLDFLPSQEEFEVLYEFARHFYEVVSRSIIGTVPATIPRKVGPGFIKLLKSMGISNPQFDFEDDEQR